LYFYVLCCPFWPPISHLVAPTGWVCYLQLEGVHKHNCQPGIKSRSLWMRDQDLPYLHYMILWKTWSRKHKILNATIRDGSRLGKALCYDTGLCI
jgi:hypothetical protein